MPPSGKASRSGVEQVVEVDPLLVYFTFSRIRPRFSCGRTIESTLQQFRDGELQPRDLPLLSVLTDGAHQHYYSQNNRRLYMYKQLRREGFLDTLPVRLRPLPQTKRMHAKYTPETCTLNATLMRDTAHRDEVKDTRASAADGSDTLKFQDGFEAGDACTSPRALEKTSAGCDAARSDRLPAPSLSVPPWQANNAAMASLEREMSDDGDPCNVPARSKQNKSQQQGKSTLPQQQQQQPSAYHSGNASRRQRRRKGAAAPAAARSPSISRGDSGGTSALEKELCRFGLNM
ncbi:hypothetical protein JKF63_05958 [Porcisia hertigi]|uniref:Uncharacterized protein n=1 Tax=Porcisia hertigi TaxID=2761500 RepID=A0A836IWP6_9TRYP|nr:hypothetical protein JKF63_05958 [Porcisia hertigi]